MGLGPSWAKSSSIYDQPSIKRFQTPTVGGGTAYLPTPPNPDPANFRIEKHQELNGYLILLVKYPDCTNYEGNKILVYRDLTYAEVKKFKTLDPHFSNSKTFASPCARFEPTLVGWGLARRMCKV